MRKSRFVPLDTTHPSVPEVRLCDHEECQRPGEFRAPKNPRNLKDFYWFCLDHIRDYNKRWDFYKGMSPEEIEKSRISDITWNRPSWPVGGWRLLLEKLSSTEDLDPFLRATVVSQALPKEVNRALNVLGLSLPLTMEELKKQYKKLAKKYHPDLNPKDSKAEENLKKINEAYQIIKKQLRNL